MRRRVPRDPESRRESIWSISPGWRNAYFAIFSVSTLITSCVIVAYKVSNRGDTGLVKTYLSTTESLVSNGVALAIVIYATMEVMETIMVFANYLRQNLLEPLKERQRAEGHAEGRAEGRTEGRAEGRTEGRAEGRTEGRAEGRTEGRAEGRTEGRAESTAEWQNWNARRVKVAAKGEPFDEPPPDLD